MKVKVTIQTGSSASAIVTKMLEDKAAIAKAIRTGNVNTLKKRGISANTPKT